MMMMTVGQLMEWFVGETEVLGESCFSAALSTTNLKGSNPGRRDGKPVTNLLSYSTA
jgi:hypothetical protein